jgi:predicted  nucleic acid-binding Zn-ribbon protein
MKFFRCIENGERYKTKEDSNYLDNCPVCNTRLFYNRYKNCHVTDMETYEEFPIEISMEFCIKCGLLFIRENY